MTAEQREAIETLRMIADDYGFPYTQSMKRAIRLVDEFLTTSGWIKTSERMPEIGQEVLATHENWKGSCIVAKYEQDDDYTIEWLVWTQGTDKWDLHLVSHWQPLPEPPK